MNWRDQCREKLITAQQAAAMVQSGQRVLFGLGTVEPQYIANALCDRWRELRDVEILTSNTMKPYPWFEKERSSAFKIQAGYLSGYSRPLYQEKRLEFSINTVYSPAKWLEPSRWAAMMNADVCLLTVSPPNAQGFCSFGEHLWYSRAWVERSTLVIAEVNPLLVRTGGDNYVHVSQIDYLVEQPEPIRPFSMTLVVSPDEQAAAEKIGALVASLIRDGDTIQIGLGSVSMAAGFYLREKNDLGVHSEIITSAMIDLYKRGVLTGKKKTLHPERMVATGMFIEPEDYAFVDGNPIIELRDAFYTNSPAVIAQNRNQVAINNALAVDFTGQVTAEAFGPQMYTGVAGQLDFVLGAYLSPGGRSITILPSTARGGMVSRIVPMFPEGQIVSLPRTYVDYVVTEYGVACLAGATEQKRAELLIEIAHPQFRDELKEAARKRFG
ncbi:MAG TPA: acetyl-CoA hydrolase/transferase C-terminal domain-containing protein [Methylomirabilota bacterium]|nr:acetyl-CoA hydrolase/transferase C-terminal domain-containing protein [Methylomirabilota bacterium]